MKVNVPNIPGPTTPLCWEPGPTMERCDRRAGHGGRHTWEMAAALARTCEWTGDNDPDFCDGWDTACGEKFTFIEGGPNDNGMKFCCYCGGALRETHTPVMESNDDD